ncbi:hypothetical protein EVG20_g7486 [Dentipellis fragilis]|uniref:pH-response transcription factor pacC/RIM101 n=1 Tax=Dentipellis fragilis TaxID=205917 RepID=A0A4Y9YFM8_9AGAM|nr:hypothetical protein EVG20_g7486 [Dentipellis fragilis]
MASSSPEPTLPTYASAYPNTISKIIRSADGTRIFAEATGSPANPHVVLVPGVGFSACVFDAFCADLRLLAAIYIVGSPPPARCIDIVHVLTKDQVRADRARSGRSDAALTEEKHESKRYAEDFDAVMKAFDLHHPVFVGWSYEGTWLADITAHLPPFTLSSCVLLAGMPYAQGLLERICTPALLALFPAVLSSDARTAQDAQRATVDLMFSSSSTKPPVLTYAQRLVYYGSRMDAAYVGRLAERTQDRAASAVGWSSPKRQSSERDPHSVHVWFCGGGGAAAQALVRQGLSFESEDRGEETRVKAQDVSPVQIAVLSPQSPFIVMSHSHLWHPTPFDIPDDNPSSQPPNMSWSDWGLSYESFALAQSTSAGHYDAQHAPRSNSMSFLPSAGPFPESSQRTVLPEPQCASFDTELFGHIPDSQPKLSSFSAAEPCNQSIFPTFSESDKENPGLGSSAFASSHCRSSSLSASASHASSRSSVSSLDPLEQDAGNFSFVNAMHQMHPAPHAPVPISHAQQPPSRPSSNSNTAVRRTMGMFHANPFASTAPEAPRLPARNAQSRASTPSLLAFRLHSSDLEPLEDSEDPFPLRVEDLAVRDDEKVYEGLSHSFFLGKSEPPRRSSAPSSMHTSPWHVPPSPSVSPAISATSSPSVLSEQSECSSDASPAFTTQPITSPPHHPSTAAKVKRKSKMHCCEVCGKAFPRPSGLATHMNSHSGAKPFKCPLKDCPKMFTVRSNAKRHLRTHGIHITSSRSPSSSSSKQDGGARVIGFEDPVVMDVDYAPDMGPGGKQWRVKWMGQNSEAQNLNQMAAPREEARALRTPTEGTRPARGDGHWGPCDAGRGLRVDGTGADLPRSSQWGMRTEVLSGPVASSDHGIFAF